MSRESVGRARLQKWIATGAVGLIMSGCADPTAPTYRIVVIGYVERGATLSLALFQGAASVPTGNVVWTASPTSAVSMHPGGVAQLTDTGAATITARVGSTNTALPLHIATPPTIVFDLQDSGGTGNRDVYRETLDGRDLIRLTSATADNEQPAASSTQVIFTSYRDGHAALYTVPVVGGTETRLTAAPAPASQAALSSDGTKLAFISPSGGTDHLWASAADGTGAALVLGSPAFQVALQSSPSWSPAGDTIAVMSTELGTPALFSIAVSATQEVALTTGISTDLSPAWSADGQTIAFASTRDGTLNLFTLSVATDAVAGVTTSPGPAGEPAWLHDGRIVFVSETGTSTQMRWLDPTHPDTSYVIATPASGNPHHPSELRLPTP